EQGTERDAATILREAGVATRPTAVDVDDLVAPEPATSATIAPAVADRPASGDAAGRHEGTLKVYNGARGFGFIARADDDDVFVHRTHLPAGRRLRVGEPV